jgi:phage virion morphogenesis protein
MHLEGDLYKLLDTLQNLSSMDFSGVNLALAESMRTETIERFKKEEDPYGKKWIPSIKASQGGFSIKASQGGTNIRTSRSSIGGKTLTDTAMLRRSIKSKASSTGFAIGTNKIYARTHQFGDTRVIRGKNKSVSVTIPARPYLGLSNKDIDEIKYMLESLVGSNIL